MDNLIKFLHSVYPMSPVLEDHLRSILKTKQLKKKEFLLKAGTTCKNVYFVQQGLLRCYYLDDGNEICKWFMKEGDVVYSVRSFLRQTASNEYIQALENCELYYITYNELQDIYERFLEFNVQRGKLTENYYLMSDFREDLLRLKKSIDKYKCLLENYPELLNRVPTQYMASYIAVSHSTMFRLKSQIRRHR